MGVNSSLPPFSKLPVKSQYFRFATPVQAICGERAPGMSFLQSVNVLRQKLDISAGLSLPAAISAMSQLMGLAEQHEDGSAISLPDQVATLMEVMELSAPCADGSERDDLDSISTPCEGDTPSALTSWGATSASDMSNLSSVKAKQTTLGAHFGAGILKRYEKGKLVGSELAQAHEKWAAPELGPRSICKCGKTFDHAPAFLVHRKFCTRAAAAEVLADMDMAVDDDASTSSAPVRVTTDPATETAADGEQSDNDSREPAGMSSKRLKNNQGFKRSGLKQGQRKMSHTLIFKYQVAMEFDARLNLKAEGVTKTPLQDVSDMFSGLSASNIWNWHQQLNELRRALTHENSGMRGFRNRLGDIVAVKSRAARRLTLHRGRAATFQVAEAELYAEHKVCAPFQLTCKLVTSLDDVCLPLH